jgi:hypothetical protein
MAKYVVIRRTKYNNGYEYDIPAYLEKPSETRTEALDRLKAHMTLTSTDSISLKSEYEIVEVANG